MKLAVDASAARVGGGPSRVHELVLGLPALAPQHEYLFIVGHGLKPQVATHTIRVPTILRSLPARIAWEHLFLPPRLTQERVHALLGPFNVLPLGPGLAKRIRTAVIVSNIIPFVPQVWRIEASYQWFRNQLLRKLTLSALRRADNVFLLSHYARKVLGRHVADSKVTILPMAPPSPQVLSAADDVLVPNLPHMPIFITAGTLYPYKGVQDAIQAVYQLKKEGLEVALYVCGDPLDDRYASELQVMAETLVPGSVAFLSHLEQRQVLALMKRGVATLVCSRIENMSRVPVETMAVGSVVISTKLEATMEACGDAALYYEPGDISALASHMKDALDARKRAALVSRSHERLANVDWLSASRMILETLELL